MVLLYRFILKISKELFHFQNKLFTDPFIAPFLQQRSLALLNKLTFFFFKIEANVIQMTNRMIDIRHQSINTLIPALSAKSTSEFDAPIY